MNSVASRGAPGRPPPLGKLLSLTTTSVERSVGQTASVVMYGNVNRGRVRAQAARIGDVQQIDDERPHRLRARQPHFMDPFDLCVGPHGAVALDAEKVAGAVAAEDLFEANQFGQALALEWHRPRLVEEGTAGRDRTRTSGGLLRA